MRQPSRSGTTSTYHRRERHAQAMHHDCVAAFVHENQADHADRIAPAEKDRISRRRENHRSKRHHLRQFERDQNVPASHAHTHAHESHARLRLPVGAVERAARNDDNVGGDAGRSGDGSRARPITNSAVIARGATHLVLPKRSAANEPAPSKRPNKPRPGPAPPVASPRCGSTKATVTLLAANARV